MYKKIIINVITVIGYVARNNIYDIADWGSIIQQIMKGNTMKATRVFFMLFVLAALCGNVMAESDSISLSHDYAAPAVSDTHDYAGGIYIGPGERINWSLSASSGNFGGSDIAYAKAEIYPDGGGGNAVVGYGGSQSDSGFYQPFWGDIYNLHVHIWSEQYAFCSATASCNW